MMLSLGLASCGGGSGGTNAQLLPELNVSASDREALAGGECITLKSAKANTAGTVTWSIESGSVGTLSATSGDTVAWCPPASGSTAKDTEVRIRARSGETTEVVALTLLPPAGLYTVAGDTDPASNAPNTFTSGGSMAVGKDGKIYVVDFRGTSILEVSADGSVRPYLEGTPDLFVPIGRMVADPDGNLYVASSSRQRIYRIGTNREIRSIAGGSSGFADGAGENAQFRSPAYIARDAAGNLYVTDSLWDKRIRKITPDGNVTSIAGTCVIYSFHSDRFCMQDFKDGAREDARFYALSGIAADRTGNIYVGDSNTIRKIDPTGYVTTVAGNRGINDVDGLGTAAQFNIIGNLSVDENGTVYAVDISNASIRRIATDGRVSTIARFGREAGQPLGGEQGVPTDIVATSPHTLLLLRRTVIQRLVF
jgi:sugar lactone lactonase YvrE